MKKLIALTFAMLLLGAGIASATDFSITGSYYARGTYFDNVQAAPTATANSFANYDHELSLDTTFQIDDTTRIFARFEMRDETWDTVNSAREGHTGNQLAELDDNIILEQVYGQHTFTNGHTLRVGKMPAGAWGTTFQDNGTEAYRVWYSIPTAFATFFPILQKTIEGGNAIFGEDNDADFYILGIVAKAGAVNIKPLFVYKDINAAAVGGDYEELLCNIAFDGTFGNVGFEAEFGVKDGDFEAAAVQDFTTYGAYVNVWMMAGPAKVGILGAYGSYDDDAGMSHDFGDDFEAGGALIMGDDITFDGSGNDLSSGQLVAVYADYAVTDQLSFGGYLGYAKCGVDDNGIWDGADVYEISADATYAITPNLTYKVAAGYAQLDYGNNAVADPDESIEVMHRIDFSF